MLKIIHPFLWLKKLMPQGLLGRSALIMIAPVLLVQTLTTYVFYDRHWKKMTELLAENIAGSISASHDLLSHNFKDPEWLERFKAFSERNFNLKVSFSPLAFDLPKQDTEKLSWRETHLYKQLSKNMATDFYLSISESTINVSIIDGGQVIQFSTPTKRLFTRTTPILIWWAVTSPLFFLIIAFVFMRNQVRPLRDLAFKVEEFGKGRHVDPLKPSGAREVRQVARAFNAMRDRIMAQIKQRTEMLAGVSHDLRTPLTRMSLEVALLPESETTTALQEDIRHMRHMIDEYLAFVQGAAGEPMSPIDLKILIQKDLKVDFLNRVKIIFPKDPCWILGRPEGLIRCFTNLVENALKYAKKAEISIELLEKSIAIYVDDNGPGIAPSYREDVFKPFFRLDESRNTETGGVGLGLAIARDIIHSHGGTIKLGDSPMGGLRVHVDLPA